MTIDTILADLATAQQSLKRSSDAFDDAMTGLRTLMEAIAAANHAQGAAIDAVVSATNSALTLMKGKPQ